MLSSVRSQYKSYWKNTIFWALSWMIVAFGQPSWNPILPVIASVCGYALFWQTLKQIKERRQRFWRGCLWFMCVQAIQLSWMTATAYHGWYILLVYLAILIWFGIQFGILTACLPQGLHTSFLEACGIASLWTLMEWSRIFVFCGFPFNMSGIALAGTLISAQLAAVGGIFGLSFLVIFINILCLRVLRSLEHKNIRWYLGSIGGLYILGGSHLAYHTYKMNQENSVYHVALVQTGLKPEEKVPLSGKTEFFISPFDQWRRILSYLQEHAISPLDLIVLPEAAVPYGAHREVYSIEDVKWIFQEMWGLGYERYFPPLEPNKKFVSNIFWAQAIANYYQSELVIGLDDYDSRLDESYNAAFHLFPNTVSAHRYEKCILVPLAEYLPIKFLEPLVKKYGIFDFSTPGKGPKVFGGQVPTAISICYEECFGQFIRQGKKQGAQLLVNVTNDGWYLPSKLPEEHFYHARLRSIENGAPLLRACNTGITSVIDSVGRVRASLQKMQEAHIARGALVATVPLYHYVTFYTLYGDTPLIILCVMNLLVFMWSRRFLLKRLTIST